MLNVEKIRLMTQLSIYDKKEGKAIRDVSKYFKADYLSRRIFMALVHYTLCFILIAMLLMLVNIEEFLMHLNIPFLVASVRVLLFMYVLGLIGMMLFSYVRYAHSYDDMHRKSLFYMAKLDKLLQMEEAPDMKLNIESAGSEFYREKSGTIRNLNTESGQGQRSSAPVLNDGNKIKKPQKKKTPKNAVVAKDEERLNEPIEPQGGWLDDPIPPEEGWLDDPMEPEGGWLDEQDDTDDQSSFDDSLHQHMNDKSDKTKIRNSSTDGIQLLNIKK